MNQNDMQHFCVHDLIEYFAEPDIVCYWKPDIKEKDIPFEQASLSPQITAIKNNDIYFYKGLHITCQGHILSVPLPNIYAYHQPIFISDDMVLQIQSIFKKVHQWVDIMKKRSITQKHFEKGFQRFSLDKESPAFY